MTRFVFSPINNDPHPNIPPGPPVSVWHAEVSELTDPTAPASEQHTKFSWVELVDNEGEPIDNFFFGGVKSHAWQQVLAISNLYAFPETSVDHPLSTITPELFQGMWQAVLARSTPGHTLDVDGWRVDPNDPQSAFNMALGYREAITYLGQQFDANFNIENFLSVTTPGT